MLSRTPVQGSRPVEWCNSGPDSLSFRGHRMRLREYRPRNSTKENHTLALSQPSLLDLVNAFDDFDGVHVVRSAVQVILHELIEAEAAVLIGAERHERNGHRSRIPSTTAGDLGLAILKSRAGLFFPSLLNRRLRIDQALFAVAIRAYVTGASVRKGHGLVKALGADVGISKSEVSRTCAHLDTEVAAFDDRDPSETASPYVFLDATYCKARIGGGKDGEGSPVVSQPSSWPLVSALTAAARSLGSRSMTVRTARSGPRSCAH